MTRKMKRHQRKNLKTIKFLKRKWYLKWEKYTNEGVKIKEVEM